MSTMITTANSHARPRSVPGWLAQCLHALRGQPHAARSTADLLERAAGYEGTQPGFAADLRAAARRAEIDG